MKKYFVLDPSLSQISHAESVYHVKDGEIEMPAEVARDLVESGQLILASEALIKAGYKNVEDGANGDNAGADGKVQDPSVTNEAGNQDSGDNAGADGETEPNGEEGA